MARTSVQRGHEICVSFILIFIRFLMKTTFCTYLKINCISVQYYNVCLLFSGSLITLTNHFLQYNYIHGENMTFEAEHVR